MSAETHSQVWDRGRADALADQRDEELYALDTIEARLYRDGHRMGRREKADGGLEVLAIPDHVTEPMAKFAENLHQQINEAMHVPAHVLAPDHPSAFSDPTPDHKPKRAKPSDPAQASLF